MDNASKALILAGGILLGVMVVSISMYMIATARGVARESNQQIEQSAIDSFNRFYQSFGGSMGTAVTIRGIDFLNIVSKVQDDNWRYSDQRTSNQYINGSWNDATYQSLNSAEGVAYMNNTFTYIYNDTDGDGYIDLISIN